MPGRKRTVTQAIAAGSRPPRNSRSTRSTPARGSKVPDIYQDMLNEAQVQPEPQNPSPERPLKKRRSGQRNATNRSIPPAPTKQDLSPSEPGADSDNQSDDDVEFQDVALPTANVQTLYRDSDEEDENEDDIEFEDVDFLRPTGHDVVYEAPKTLELDLSARAAATPRKTVDRRKPINKEEKSRRVEIHTMHLLCLLAHTARRNRWCNDQATQDNLRPLLTDKMVTYLNPGSHLTQFGRTNSLKEGLKLVNIMFKTKFTVTERGCRRALWADKEEHLQNYQLPEDAEMPMEKSDFRKASQTLEGSRDVGAQLYCALLRSAGVEARLVCSLQPLSFVTGGPPMVKPSKGKGRLSLEEQLARIPKYDTSFESPATKSTPLSGSGRRRLGHPTATSFNVPTTAQPAQKEIASTPKKIRESPFPVYWVEILDEAHQKWQPTDPLVTDSFWKPQKFEPPASDRESCMTYVVSFEADGTAKDVTRRYAKAYNAKTRKMRIESAEMGGKWWRKALKTYSRGYDTDMDQIEDNELNAMESREPMPRNVADFKDHPIYALERHMRRHEVLVPGATSAGTVGAGSKGPLEKIFRRRDVRIARSREKWYRLGREVKADEVPVKFLPKRAKPKSNLFGSDEEEDNDGHAADSDTVGTPIYTHEQTVLYKPPPVVAGKIPKNRYGNLDLYVRSMVPEGGAYVADELGAQASFILGIDYAPALTGFLFKGRKGTAVLHGVVVAAENEAAVLATISGLKDLEEEMQNAQRAGEVLKAWKRLLMMLRVRERIWANANPNEDVDNQEETEMNVDGENGSLDEAGAESAGAESDPAEEGGGFIIDDDYAGGFMVD